MRSVPKALAALVLSLGVTSQGPQKVVPPSRFLVWPRATISYYISDGDFGNIKAPQVASVVDEAFRAWHDVDPRLIPNVRLGRNRSPWKLQTSDDYRNLLGSTERAIFIAYDPGDVGAKSNGTLPEKAYPNTRTQPDDKNLALQSAVILIPKRIGDPGVVDTPTFREIIFHEVGHALGLSHALLNTRAELKDGTHQQTPAIMFPFTNGAASLYESDKAWIAYLYSPDGTVPAKYGAIRGTLLDRFGRVPENGVVLVAVRTDARGVTNEAQGLRFNGLSGYNDVPGRFVIPVVPGHYRIFAQSIASRFELLGYRNQQSFGAGSRITNQVLRIFHVLGQEDKPYFEYIARHDELEQDWLDPSDVLVNAGKYTNQPLRLH
jgi:hypothetical protein